MATTGTTYTLLVFRPEAADDPDAPHIESPFDGIEVLYIGSDEDHVNALIERYHGEHPEWKFSIEEGS